MSATGEVSGVGRVSGTGSGSGGGGRVVVDVDGIEVRYGATRALRDVSCRVVEGDVLALIGANGAGKSTFLRALAGLRAPRSGTIRIFDEDTTRRPAHEVARRGLCLVPEGRQLFTDLTVSENLLMGCHRLGRDRDGTATRAKFERVHALFPILADFADRRAGMLSGGQQQMVAIGRALMGEPRILLLDEPSLGLAPAYVTQILDVVAELARDGMTVVLAEQNARAALRTADRGVVLANGVLTHSAPAAELLHDDDVSRHYLGMGADGRDGGDGGDADPDGADGDGADGTGATAPRRLPAGLDRLDV